MNTDTSFISSSGLPLVLLLLAAVQVVGLLLLWRRTAADAAAAAAERAADRAALQAAQMAAQSADAALMAQMAQAVQAGQWHEPVQQVERSLRDELQRLAQGQRHDLSQTQQSLLQQGAEVARLQNDQIDGFRLQLASAQQAMSTGLQQQSAHQGEALQRLSDSLAQQLRALATSNEAKLTDMRTQVEARLSALQEGNEKKLEQMRQTVDEKLHATLEQRLGESFRQVAERLEQVHRGLGDMQTLARDVGSLNRVLTNVKTRGIVGEVQLAALLEQVLTIEQYAANVEVVPHSGARVEFAIRLPGRAARRTLVAGAASEATDALGDTPLWLPIDAKFPREDYERLLDAQERSDAPAVEAAARALEQRIRLEAKTIRDKYIAAPHTTDFAILFLPTEGLYAEVLRRPGLVQSLQGEHRITLAGPTTLLAILNSLQMGFRTLALEQRSAEVWQVLGAVKTEFTKFGDVLAKTRKKLEEATNTIDSAEVRTRALTRKLRSVEALPEPASASLLGPLGGEESTAGDGAADDAALGGTPQEEGA